MYTDVKNNLYAFVCDGEVKYVGKTTRLLRTRMYHYCRPGATQPTNIKNNANILDMLSQNVAVDIFVLPDNGLMHYRQFHVNLAAGLEDSIIKVINPEWNGFKKTELKVEAVVLNDGEIIPTKKAKYYTFNMAATYWNRGFFNVPTISSQEFFSDGEQIKILVGDGNSSITGMINRTANLSGSPRIMGSAELRNYFQSTFRINDIVTFEVTTLTTMKIDFKSQQNLIT